MIQLITTYGFDPALRHGALVKATFEFSERNTVRLQRFKICFQWGENSEFAMGEKVPVAKIHSVGDSIIRTIAPDNLPVGIDWDPYTSYWNARRLQVTKIAYFMGYITRGLQSQGNPVVYIEPSELRRILKLKAGVDKKQVWIMFTSQVEVLNQKEALSDGHHDIADALVLAYLIAKAQRDISHEQQ